VPAYVLLVGAPVLCLFGILEIGKGIAAPLSIGGDWIVQFDPAADCASGLAHLRQPALSISQSGPGGLMTLNAGNDGRSTIFPATITGATLTAASLTATITGTAGQRVLEGKFDFDGCAPVAFRATRQGPAKKSGE
jgi:hypothetical protein